MSGSSAQQQFLQRGGPMSAVLDAKYESGELQRDTPYAEYPKMLRRSLGVKQFPRHTEIIRGNTTAVQDWTDEHEVFEETVVNSEAEEEAVLAGGKSEGQLEEERQEMIAEARRRGISVDPTWGVVRLQRELGSAPTSETIEAMRTKIADLEEKAQLRARIAELEAHMSGHNRDPRDYPGYQPPAEMVPISEVEDIRAQLTALGVHVDQRWGISRLRQELESATAP